jgi:hypothetical protein
VAIGQKMNRSGFTYLDGTIILSDFTYSNGHWPKGLFSLKIER